MPLSSFQTRVLTLLAANRSPDSFVAGGTVLNATSDTPRFSADVDIFHDVQESVAISAERDVAILQQHDHIVKWLLRQPMFQRADIRLGPDNVRLEWLFDSAFRFFPVEIDPVCGYRLNIYDAAANKVLALMGRGEPRDYLDTIYFHENRLSLATLCWAAAGKDPGVNPIFILEEARRAAHYRPEDFATLELNGPIDVPRWSQIWRSAAAEAEALLPQLPAEEAGCFYLDELNRIVPPDPRSPQFKRLRRHFGSVRGAWPIIRT